jgi:23S rRNA pseudouridine1911/1915/1917 synthase
MSEEDFSLLVEDDNIQEELYEHFNFKVDKGQQMLRIDKFLMGRIENVTRNKLQNAIRAASVLVNDAVVKSNYRVKPLDEIRIVLSTPPREVEIIPQEIPLEIMYEDEEIIVVNKAAGMVVHPGYNNYDGTLINALCYHLSKEYLNEIQIPYLVHRIDKDTSGVLLIAKTEFAQSKLALQFFNHSIERKYIALAWGNFVEDTGTVEGHIGRSLKDRRVMSVFPNGEYGKSAITHYKVLERFGYVSTIECQLETGRTHQIRAHMRHIGHALFNDATYGGDRALKGTTFTKYKQFVDNCFNIIPRQALHAKSLGFIHPRTNEYIFFDSDLPDDMTQVIKKWREYSIHQNLENLQD